MKISTSYDEEKRKEEKRGEDGEREGKEGRERGESSNLFKQTLLGYYLHTIK